MRIGVYSFGGCEGCRYWLIDSILRVCEELGAEIVYEPLIGLSKESSEYDMVVIEGAVCTDEDSKKLRSLRSRAKYLIALGSCALLSGVPGNKRFTDPHAVEMVYFGKPLPKKPIDVKPITAYVQVDYWIRGCPPDRENFERLFRAIISGIVSGKLFKLHERRLEFCRDEFASIEGSVLRLDGDKCIVCGRCVGACERMGVYAIDYAYRSISTIVTTPFSIPFDESTCILCGQCTLVCPVGAIHERSDLERVQRILSRSTALRAYIEPESLAAMSSYFNREVEVIVGALIARGFESVTVYLPEHHADTNKPLMPASEAERRFINNFYPQLAELLSEPPAPPGGSSVLITPCLAKKAQVREGLVLTTREAIKLISSIDLDEVEEALPIMPSKRNAGFREVHGPDNVTKLLEEYARGVCVKEPTILKMCPGGCVRGGGQPYYNEDLYRRIDEALARIFSTLLVIR